LRRDTYGACHLCCRGVRWTAFSALPFMSFPFPIYVLFEPRSAPQDRSDLLPRNGIHQPADVLIHLRPRCLDGRDRTRRGHVKHQLSVLRRCLLELRDSGMRQSPDFAGSSTKPHQATATLPETRCPLGPSRSQHY